MQTAQSTQMTFLPGLLEQISESRRLMAVQKGEKVFSQGDRADAIYFVETGRVKLAVVSSTGKEAVLGILAPHDFFGEECLIHESLRISTATALEPSSVIPVHKRALLRALRAQPALSEKFTTSLLKRTIALEEDLCDQLFNHSEKRLARVLLKVARLQSDQAVADVIMPSLNHETLAEMVGTTRARITYFMNKFRTMGLIDYDGRRIVITDRLANAVLQDPPDRPAF